MADHKASPGRSGSFFVVLLAVAAAATVGYFGLGMPGMDHGGDAMGDMGGMEVSDMAVDVAEFASRVASPATFVVNVHVADEGSIAGTDAAVAYDELTATAELPKDGSTPIALYCKTGRMSAAAATSLMEAGYTNVVYLEGGMDRWTAAGRALE